MTANTWNQILHTDGRGRAWDFLNPDPAAIDWHTIAIVLARTPRFNGHTTGGVYSVAQHLVEGARAILRAGYTRDVAAAYLLHDAHEFVIGDDVRPKVEALAALAGEAASLVPDEWTRAAAAKWLKAAFKELKRRADAVIYPAAGLSWPLSPEAEAVVRQFDNRVLRTEADARTGPRVAPWAAVVEDACPVEGADCSPWSAELAASLWLSLAKELLPSLSSHEPQSDGPDCNCCEPGPDMQAERFKLWKDCDDILRDNSDAAFVRTMQDLRGWPDSLARAKMAPSMQDLRSGQSGVVQDDIEDDLPCSKCGAMSGGDWSQCERSCPLYMSPNYKPWAGMQDLRGWPDSPAISVGDTIHYPCGGTGKVVLVADSSADGVTVRSHVPGDKVVIVAKARGNVKDWCDWADGSRSVPGTCTACGGFFGMLHAPSVCHRGGNVRTPAG